MEKTEKFHKQFSAVARKARLEELEHLTGCPIAVVIEGRCQEIGCQNNLLKPDEKIKTPFELCYRLQSLIEDDCTLLKETAFEGFNELKNTEGKDTPATTVPKPIIDTRLRQRCVL